MPYLAYDFGVRVWISAWQGQRLSQLTILFLLHCCAAAHNASKGHIVVGPYELERLSHWVVLYATGLLVFCGFLLLGALYRHSVRTIFNCNVPSKCMPSFGVHLEMLRPLEVIWRYLTYRFRVLPDVIVLGEVRCGTTTMCQHLASLDGCHAPFCLWKHPELDKKETFFFVGHYLGNVDPQLYRMCFPLSVTRYFYTTILRRPFFTFDGCAQYLSSPTAAYLIAQAYKDAGQPPPVLVACVRDPIDQTLSWWNYENNAISWGRSMGLVDCHTAIRSPDYPPETLCQAMTFSSSDMVERMYQRAERLFANLKCEPHVSFHLPEWAMTWPGGQLSGIGRNGRFAANIQRYERVFFEVFGDRQSQQFPTFPSSSTLQFVNVVQLDSMKSNEPLRSSLSSIINQINQRNSRKQPVVKPNHVRMVVHRNASVNLAGTITVEERTRMMELFSSDTSELETLCGTQFGWKTSPFPGLG